MSCSFRLDIVQIGAGQEGRAVISLLDDRGLEAVSAAAGDRGVGIHLRILGHDQNDVVAVTDLLALLVSDGLELGSIF